MIEPMRAVLIELDGVALPMAFATETLLPLTQARLGAFIAEHAEDPDVVEALEETGRLLGGYDLQPGQAELVLLRWLKQNRKMTPLKTIQGMILRESYEAGAIKAELYPDVAAALKSWASAGLRLFVYSSHSSLAQQLLLSHGASGDLTSLCEAFFDTSAGQKTEPASYREICERLALPPASVLVLSGDEEELDAARSAGLATVFIAREGGADSGHPVHPDFASLVLECSAEPPPKDRIADDLGPVGKTASFILETRNGTRQEITGKAGVSLMKLIRRAGIEELVAQCGGSCACATCHVYVTLPQGVEAPSAGAGETRMLAAASHRRISSRLACQIKFDDAFDGMEVLVAPETPMAL
jgi:enolase-phosphatase E1